MKRMFITGIFLLAWQAIYAQGFAQAEYFIDTDPGIGNGVAVPMTITNADSVQFNVSVSSSSLSIGFHTIAIRIKENSGVWGLFESRGFYVSGSGMSISDIIAAEYFIDNDPGPGNGTPVSPGTPGNTANFTIALTATALSEGFHTIAIRTKDADGNWGLFESRGFYISSSIMNGANIIAAEYFVDTDPGMGNATPVSVGTAGDTVNFSIALNTTSLAEGFHTIAIRTKDADGNWGLFESRAFYISSGTTNAANITAAEYFIDADPGVGNAATLSTGASGNTVNFTAAVPATSLSEGFHTIAIRTKDADGNWGLFETRGFYIASAANASLNNIVAAEYFIDTDPGIGNGSALSVTTVSQAFVCATPAGLSNGQHFLFIRVKDNTDLWSLTEIDTFDVTSNPTPITGFHLSAAKKDAEAWLYWETLTEINTKHFEIEKSRNGIDFEKIGVEKAAGNSMEKIHYRFIDEKPYSELNFYRIKQTDINGAFTYSNIVSILFEQAAQAIRLYPNPTSDWIYAEMPQQGNYQLQCFNAQGQMALSTSFTDIKLIQLSTHSLANGSYYIRISDGVHVFNASFIKSE